MAMKRIAVLDADSHVFEPAEIWTQYMEPEYRVAARSAFYFSQDADGLCTVILNGAPAAAIDSGRLNRRAIWRPGMSPEEIGRIDPAKPYPINPGAQNASSRLKDMDEIGVDKALLFPTLFAEYLPAVANPDLAYAFSRAYNNWISDFCKSAPDRLFPVGILPMQDASFAIEEARRIAARGFKAAFIRPAFIHQQNFLSHSQTIAFPANGLGFNIRYWPDPRLYVDAGLADANGNPDHKPNDSIDSFLQGHYFEAFEIGLVPNMKTISPALGEGHYRLMGWHTAEAMDHGAGSGVALSVDQELPGQMVPFMRVGYCPAGASRTSTEVDWGVVSVAPFQRSTDRLGFGATWARPTPPSTHDQFAFELFYRAQMVDGFQVTPDAEFIINPALNPSSSFQAVFGIRVRTYL
jgi:hypothetical protein